MVLIIILASNKLLSQCLAMVICINDYYLAHFRLLLIQDQRIILDTLTISRLAAVRRAANRALPFFIGHKANRTHCNIKSVSTQLSFHKYLPTDLAQSIPSIPLLVRR